ncbi:GGDEF domain-containing response regulator [Sulfurimonas sp. SAG-AH-194-L11]|nr:GGDEF domain-containing response regulator [Sulfurimonas sp. SAG-AH-194-L11]MDF1876622.1 GGDEF domain-containing response regulator [Sulfurimonas sp. SAG-AH-194-L11]
MKEYNLLTFDNSQHYHDELSSQLESLDINIIYTTSKEEALEYLMDNKANLILIYISLDSIEILELLENIHNDIENKDTPIILISHLEDYDHLSSTLKEHNIISLFTYKSYLHQLKNLLVYLQSIDTVQKTLTNELTQSELRNIIDPLTGAYNRYGAEDKFYQLTSRVKAYQEPFSLIMLDIDHFKKVNDTYGHDVGDAVLISISKLMQKSIRDNDAFIRFGGEEFFIFIANSDLSIATNIAQKLHALIKSTHHSDKNLSITASFGVTEYRLNEELNSLVKRVDTLLYKAKKTGRDRVIAE